MLRNEPAPAGLLSPRRALHPNDLLFMIDAQDHPATPPKQEAAHAVDEAIDEVLLQGTEITASNSISSRRVISRSTEAIRPSQAAARKTRRDNALESFTTAPLQ